MSDNPHPNDSIIQEEEKKEEDDKDVCTDLNKNNNREEDEERKSDFSRQDSRVEIPPYRRRDQDFDLKSIEYDLIEGLEQTLGIYPDEIFEIIFKFRLCNNHDDWPEDVLVYFSDGEENRQINYVDEV